MPESIPVECPECEKRYRVSADLAGRSIACKYCGTRFVAEAENEAASETMERGPGASRWPFLAMVGVSGLLAVALAIVALMNLALRRERDNALAMAEAAAQFQDQRNQEPAAVRPIPAHPRTSSEPAAASGDAPTLWQAFGQNALAADATYKGKVVEVRGNVSKIGADAAGRYFVGFKVIEFAGMSPAEVRALSPRERKWFTEGHPPNVLCYMEPDHRAEFATVKVGQQITIVGRCAGARKDPDVYQGYVVELEDCVLKRGSR